MPFPRAVVSILGALALLTLPVQAQIRSEPPITAADGSLVLTTHDQRLVLPPPDWATSSDDLLTSFEAEFRSGDDEADLQFYRKGDVYALAKVGYGAHVVRDAAADPVSYRDVILDGFTRACVPGLVAFVQLGDDPEDAFAPLLLICGAQRTKPAQGEIMAVSLTQSSAGVAMVFQQWRGAAFDPAVASQWPATPEAIEARARQLQAGTSLSLAD